MLLYKDPFYQTLIELNIIKKWICWRELNDLNQIIIFSLTWNAVLVVAGIIATATTTFTMDDWWRFYWSNDSHSTDILLMRHSEKNSKTPAVTHTCVNVTPMQMLPLWSVSLTCNLPASIVYNLWRIALMG